MRFLLPSMLNSIYTLKNIYFASDFHLNKDVLHTSAVREKHIVDWLLSIQSSADTIYLVGDLFDYWYEYATVIPRGNDLFKATLLQMRLSGVNIEIFTGNHDVWMKDYFEKDLNIKVHRNPISVTHHGKSLYIGHGDGLGPGDLGYKYLKRIFTSKWCQWLFSRLHPNLAIKIMKACSNLSSKYNTDATQDTQSLILSEEWLSQYSESINAQNHHDYYIFGHRHIPLIYQLSNHVSYYYNLGDWMNHYTYGVLENGQFQLKYYFNTPDSPLTNLS